MMEVIRYGKRKVWKLIMACMFFLIGSVALTYAVLFQDIMLAKKIFYSIAVVLSLGYFGLHFLVILPYLFKKNTVILSFDDKKIWTEQIEVRWTDIEKIVCSVRAKGKFGTYSPSFVLHLKNREKITIHTQNLLTNDELIQAQKSLNRAISLYEHKKFDIAEEKA
jgi:Family of unknown function (DUF5381)